MEMAAPDIKRQDLSQLDAICQEIMSIIAI
jgi:hypothetical protein